MRALLFSFFIIAASNLASAQSKWNFGVKTGINLNYVRVENEVGGVKEVSQLQRASYLVGGIINFQVSPKISLQSELLYSRKGYSEADEGEVNMNYLSAPLLFVYNPVNKLSLEVGPEFDYLLSSWIRVSGFSKSDDLKWFHSFDFGMAFGIHYRIIPHLGIGTRFTYSLLDFYKLDEINLYGQNDPIFWDGKYFNRTLQFTIDYSF